MIRIRNERGNIITNIAEIKRVIKECYEKLYANKLYNLDKMCNFLERHTLPKITQKEIEHLNIPVTLKVLNC